MSYSCLKGIDNCLLNKDQLDRCFLLQFMGYRRLQVKEQNNTGFGFSFFFFFVKSGGVLCTVCIDGKTSYGEVGT